MKIYSREIEDNLSEKIISGNSIAFECDILSPEDSAKYSIENILRSSASLPENSEKQPDLYYLNSVLVSAGWNKNDDVFGVQQLWEARNTPINKQFNYMHDDSDIIGHITGAMVVDHDGNVIDNQSDAGVLPEKIDIITSAVIYKTWSERDARQRIAELIDEIDQGKWSVSMECIFSDFDYAIIGPNNENKVLARTEESSFLTKHLRAYGGSGQYQGYKIGRFFTGFYFSGKGLVAKPAGPRSIIFSKDYNPFNAKSHITFNNFLTAMENHNMSDVTKQIEDLQAGFAAEKSEIEKAHNEKLAEIALANESVIAEKDRLIASLETKAKELQDSIATMDSEKEKMMNEVEAFKQDMTKKEEDLKKMKEQYAAMMKEMKAMKRTASLIEAGATEEAAAKIINDFATADDEMFNSVIALVKTQKQVPASTAQTQDQDEVETDSSVLDEVEVSSATLANPEAVEENQNTAIAAAASWIRQSVLKSTKNLK